MKQTPKTPPIKKCQKCGADAACTDWDFDMRYWVMCENNHHLIGKCITRHRAICRWNNEQDHLSKVSE